MSNDHAVLPSELDETERAYLDWKRRKVERSLRTIEDRSCLIPFDQVWRNLGLEP